MKSYWIGEPQRLMDGRALGVELVLAALDGAAPSPANAGVAPAPPLARLGEEGTVVEVA